ncbi:MAG: carboxyltransferase domain-containing protein [Polyangiaceae bacterium]
MNAHITPLGDTAYRITLVEPLSTQARSSVVQALSRLTGVLDVVATETAFALYLQPGASLDHQALSSALDSPAVDAPLPIEHVVSVIYDGEDLDTVCEATRLSRDQLIRTHSESVYEVKTIGFLPGFAYLGPLDPALVIPRRSEPRSRVAPGSLAMAGPYTGVYPTASPGGWHLLGRVVGAHPFSISNDRGLVIGDLVRFAPVTP